MRWLLILQCEHRLISDERKVEGRDYCPTCNMTFPIVDCVEWYDADAV